MVSDETLSKNDLPVNYSTETQRGINKIDCILANHGHEVRLPIYACPILPVVLYGCETWSLTLREERRLRVFENRVLRKVFGPKRDEVTGMEKAA